MARNRSATRLSLLLTICLLMAVPASLAATSRPPARPQPTATVGPATASVLLHG